MKKISLGLLVMAFLVFGVIGNVCASTYNSFFDGVGNDFGAVNRSSVPTGSWDATYKGVLGGTYSGYYLGTFLDKNDSEAKLDALITEYLGQPFSGTYYKVDAPGTINGPLTVGYYAGNKSGTWELDNPYAIGFYSVKAANEYALYFVHPYQTSGTWSTEHLLTPNGENQPSISHISAAATAVPVPPSVWLLGSGLVGLVGLRRRFFRK